MIMSCPKEIIERLKNQKAVLENGRATWETEDPLPLDDIIQLVKKATKTLHNDEMVVQYTGDTTIVGDLHGKLFCMLRLFDVNGMPSDTRPYIFNGDFVDKGQFSLEVLIILFALKVAHPRHVFLIRGNHETEHQTMLGGTFAEIMRKYDSIELYSLIVEAFKQMPLAVLVNHDSLIIHGGLPVKEGLSLDDLKHIQRGRDPYICELDELTGSNVIRVVDSLLFQCLWNDPGEHEESTPSPRGRDVGVMEFGSNVTKAFLEKNKISRIIRSHRATRNGIEMCHEGKVITVFTAPNFSCKAGYINVQRQNNKIQPLTFKPSTWKDSYAPTQFDVIVR